MFFTLTQVCELCTMPDWGHRCSRNNSLSYVTYIYFYYSICHLTMCGAIFNSQKHDKLTENQEHEIYMQHNRTQHEFPRATWYEWLFSFSNNTAARAPCFLQCKLWPCYLRDSFRLAPPPGFHITHIPTGNLVCIIRGHRTGSGISRVEKNTSGKNLTIRSTD